jgi:ubiquitin C-terminal hydrolase
MLDRVQNDSNRVRGKPRYCELKLQGCQAQQAAEAAAYARSWEDSVVLDIFSWQLQSTMTCCSCGRASHAFDSAQELLVAIPPDSEDVTVQVGWCCWMFECAAGSIW